MHLLFVMKLPCRFVRTLFRQCENVTNNNNSEKCKILHSLNWNDLMVMASQHIDKQQKKNQMYDSIGIQNHKCKLAKDDEVKCVRTNECRMVQNGDNEFVMRACVRPTPMIRHPNLRLCSKGDIYLFILLFNSSKWAYQMCITLGNMNLTNSFTRSPTLVARSYSLRRAIFIWLLSFGIFFYARIHISILCFSFVFVFFAIFFVCATNVWFWGITAFLDIPIPLYTHRVFDGKLWQFLIYLFQLIFHIYFCLFYAIVVVLVQTYFPFGVKMCIFLLLLLLEHRITAIAYRGNGGWWWHANIDDGDIVGWFFYSLRIFPLVCFWQIPIGHLSDQKMNGISLSSGPKIAAWSYAATAAFYMHWITLYFVVYAI